MMSSMCWFSISAKLCYLTIFEGHEAICILVLQYFITILLFMEAWFGVDVLFQQNIQNNLAYRARCDFIPLSQ